MTLLPKPLQRCLIVGAALFVVSPASSRACGYHDDVATSRGILNWAYPEALHVIGAISEATAAKRLTRREIPTADPFGSHYRSMVKALETFARLMDTGSPSAPPLSFSLVPVEPMLWTRFDAGPGELRTQVHVAGPQPDDVVLISGQDVIHAIAHSELTVGEAYGLGLIRVYGSQEKIARFLHLAKNLIRPVTLHVAGPK